MIREIKMPHECLTSIVARDTAKKLSAYYDKEKFYIFQSTDKAKMGLGYLVYDKDKLGKGYKSFELIETWVKGEQLQ